MLDDIKNTRSGSTTWGWRRVKISEAPQANSDRASQKRLAAGLPDRDPRKPLQVTIVYRGGSECWWELRSRGVVVRRPGVTALQDVLSLLT